jgi:hypothetical protein
MLHRGSGRFLREPVLKDARHASVISIPDNSSIP